MNVTVVKNVLGTALIEWEDEEGLHRGMIPEETVRDGVVVDELIPLSIPVGVDWEFILADHIGAMTPQRLAKELRKAGIWTFDDLTKNVPKAEEVIRNIYGVDLSVLLRSAKEFVKSEVAHDQ